MTNLAILAFSFGMLFLMVLLHRQGLADGTGMIIATVAMMGSFGPVTALANLSNNLNQTLASGERVLSLLEEDPQVEEIVCQEKTVFEGASAERISFSYGGRRDPEGLLPGDPERPDHRYPWLQRLREIHAAEASDAVLGCAGRFCEDIRLRRPADRHQRPAGRWRPS